MQTAINTFLTVFLLLGAYFFSKQIDYPVCGIALPDQKTLAPTNDSNIAVLDHTPLIAQTLGYINVQLHFGQFSHENMNSVVNYAKKLAASLGGNGLVINQFGYANPDVIDEQQNTYTLQGVAIKTD